MPTNATATRDKERTQAAILEAATQLIREQGSGVSLASIATRAGVSKGALTHHFPSRGELEHALVAEAVARFWDLVRAHVDISENRPGKLLRGYIRALTTDSALIQEYFSPSSLCVVLGVPQPGQGHVDIDAEADAARWRDAFAADGLDPATSTVLRYAAEGLAASTGSPYLTPTDLDAARARLLELAEPNTEQ